MQQKAAQAQAAQPEAESDGEISPLTDRELLKPVTDRERAQLLKLVRLKGEVYVLRQLCVSRQTLARAIAGLDLQRVTLTRLRPRLARLLEGRAISGVPNRGAGR